MSSQSGKPDLPLLTRRVGDPFILYKPVYVTSNKVSDVAARTYFGGHGTRGQGRGRIARGQQSRFKYADPASATLNEVTTRFTHPYSVRHPQTRGRARGGMRWQPNRNGNFSGNVASRGRPQSDSKPSSLMSINTSNIATRLGFLKPEERGRGRVVSIGQPGCHNMPEPSSLMSINTPNIATRLGFLKPEERGRGRVVSIGQPGCHNMPEPSSLMSINTPNIATRLGFLKPEERGRGRVVSIGQPGCHNMPEEPSSSTFSIAARPDFVRPQAPSNRGRGVPIMGQPGDQELTEPSSSTSTNTSNVVAQLNLVRPQARGRGRGALNTGPPERLNLPAKPSNANSICTSKITSQPNVVRPQVRGHGRGALNTGPLERLNVPGQCSTESSQPCMAVKKSVFDRLTLRMKAGTSQRCCKQLAQTRLRRCSAAYGFPPTSTVLSRLGSVSTKTFRSGRREPHAPVRQGSVNCKYGTSHKHGPCKCCQNENRFVDWACCKTGEMMVQCTNEKRRTIDNLPSSRCFRIEDEYDIVESYVDQFECDDEVAGYMMVDSDDAPGYLYSPSDEGGYDAEDEYVEIGSETDHVETENKPKAKSVSWGSYSVEGESGSNDPGRINKRGVRFLPISKSSSEEDIQNVSSPVDEAKLDRELDDYMRVAAAEKGLQLINDITKFINDS